MIKTCGEVCNDKNQLKVLTDISGDIFCLPARRRSKQQVPLSTVSGRLYSPTEVVTWPFPSTIALPCWNRRLIHDAPRKRLSPTYRCGILAGCRTNINFRFLLWCVLLAPSVNLIHKFGIRSVCCTLLCIGRYLCVRFLLPTANFLASPDPPKFDRRRGFPNRATAAMFTATVINFLLSTLNIGIQAAGLIVYIRRVLILDIDYPLSQQRELVRSALRNVNIVILWVTYLPVSINLFLSDPVSIHGRWRYGSVISLSSGGLGSSSQIDSG